MNYSVQDAQGGMSILAGFLGKNHNVKVVYHNGNAVDANIETGTIRIPKLACASGITEETIQILRSMVYHESGHIAETKLSKSETPKGALFNILNALEDRRIERVLADAHLGCKAIFAWGVEYYNKRIAGQMAAGNANVPLWEALCAMGIMTEGHQPAWRLTPKADAYVKAAYEEFSTVRKAKTTNDCLEIAKRIYALLKDASDEFNEKNKPQEKKENEEKGKDEKQEKQDKQDKQDKGKQDKNGKQDKQDKKGKKEKQDKPENSQAEDMPDDSQDGDEGEEGDEGDSKEDKKDKKDSKEDKPGKGKKQKPEKDEADKDGDGADGDESDGDEQGDKGDEDGKSQGQESDLDDEATDPGKGDKDDGTESESAEPKDDSDDGDGSNSKGMSNDKDSKDSDADAGDDNDVTSNSDVPYKPSDIEDGDSDKAKEQYDSDLEDEGKGDDQRAILNERLNELFDQLSPSDKEYLARRDTDIHAVPNETPVDRANFIERRGMVASAVSSMTCALEQALRSMAKCRKDPYLRQGKIDKKRIVAITKSLSKEVFCKTRPGEKLDAAIEIIIDESGSMGNYLDVQLVAIAVGEALSQINIPFEITGTTTKHLGGCGCPSLDGFTRTNPIVYNHYKGFHETWISVRHRITQTAARFHNVDGEAVEFAAYRLAQRKESRKIILSLSDGEPCAGHGNDSDMCKNLRDVCNRVRKNGIEVYSIALGTEAPVVFYGKKYSIVVMCIEELGKSFARLLASVLTNGRVRL